MEQLVVNVRKSLYGVKNQRYKVSLLFPPMKYNFGCMSSVIRKMKPQVCPRSNVSSKGTVWWFKRGNDTSDVNLRIEDFNGEFGDKLWEWGQFRDLEHLRREAKIFLERHNNRQDWKYRKINREAMPQRRIPRDFEVDMNNLPLTDGKVHFIRLVLENGTISVLNEDNSFDKSLAHE
jgi:hypothetical protein